MNKILISAVILALIFGAGFFVLSPASVSAAIVYVERGNVEVNTGSSWQTATNEMELEQGAQVRTGDGEATVVLLEGEILHLEPHTEVLLDTINKNKIKISQVAGETWNKVTRISGVSDYTVETPNTVATVRGTEFTLNDEEVVVDEGEVDYSDKKDPERRMMVGAKKKAMRKMMEAEAMGERDDARFQMFKEKYIKQLSNVRDREIRKHKRSLALAEKQGYSEDQIKARLTDMDEGREDPDKAYDEIPTMMKRKARRAYELTKTIRKARETQAPLTPEKQQILRAKIREEVAERDMTMEEVKELPPEEREALKQEIREDVREDVKAESLGMPVPDSYEPEMIVDRDLPKAPEDELVEPERELTDKELYPDGEPKIDPDSLVVRDLADEK